MASLFDLFFDNNNYYNKPQYVKKPYNNYYNSYDDYDQYNNYYDYYNKYNNNIHNKYNKDHDINNNKNKNTNYTNTNNSNNTNNTNSKNNKSYMANNNNNNIINTTNNNKKSEFSIKETKDSITIETSLPNVDKKDIEIEIRDSVLIIQGDRKLPIVKVEPEIEQPSIEEYEEDKEEDKGKPVIYKYITIKTPPKKQQIDNSFGPFKKSLDLSNIIPFLNLNNIVSTFNNNILSIKISKLNINNNYRVRVF